MDHYFNTYFVVFIYFYHSYYIIFKDSTKKYCSEDCELIKMPGNLEDSHLVECTGFQKTDDINVGIIKAHTGLEDRSLVEKHHYKACYYAAILCILVKINLNINNILPSVIDRIIEATQKICAGVKKPKYTMIRKFEKIQILDVNYNIIIKQIFYADPENYQPDRLEQILKTFFKSYRTGILVFDNVSYAFWKNDHSYYLFDPYICDKNGCAVEEKGHACLMQICDYTIFIARVINNTDDKKSNKPYRLYSIDIAHIGKRNKKKKSKRSYKQFCKTISEKKDVDENACNYKQCSCSNDCLSSLVEISDWIHQDEQTVASFETVSACFAPIKNSKASMIEVKILNNDIHKLELAPFQLHENIRIRLYDRKYYGNSPIDEPLDLCLIAWAQIHQPTDWSIATIKGIYEASREYSMDCCLATDDSTVTRSQDYLLNEFTIANYCFRVVFAPLHNATLYSKKNWNLAKSLQKIFNTYISTGAIIVCAGVHVGTMKIGKKMFAWWLVKRTQKLRIIVSEDFVDYLKLIVKVITLKLNKLFHKTICFTLGHFTFSKKLSIKVLLNR